jgi:hypothetical protein
VHEVFGDVRPLDAIGVRGGHVVLVEPADEKCKVRPIGADGGGTAVLRVEGGQVVVEPLFERYAGAR